jgi:hypothetical protein
MRRLALALLMLNILYALWAGLRPVSDPPASTDSRSYAETLVMLEEVDWPLALNEPPSVNCPALGPFASESELRAFADEHVSGRQWQMRTEAQALPPLYRVYVPPAALGLSGTALATSIRDTIDAAGFDVDTYLVAGGELDGVVSLGLFASQANARGVYEQITGLGLAVETQTENRSRNFYWIVLSGDEDSDFAQESVAALQALNPDAGISEKLCEMIALPD